MFICLHSTKVIMGYKIGEQMYLVHYCMEGLNHVAHLHRHSWPAMQGREDATCISFTFATRVVPNCNVVNIYDGLVLEFGQYSSSSYSL